MFLPAVFIAAFAQLLATYAVRNEPMQHVLTAAQSSWLQVRVPTWMLLSILYYRNMRRMFHGHCVRLCRD
jgi:hypothetical protein